MSRDSERTEVPAALDDEPRRLPLPPAAISRVDDLPDDFLASLSSAVLAVGDVVGGRYRLVQELGTGAMGQVFIAENMAIGCSVAIKVLKTELLADSSFRQRFQREAEAIAAVEHRNVVRFLDLVVGDPTFLVMEYVRGPTLQNRLREEQRLSVDSALWIARRLCWALHATHEAGVIHRDIKPANVILSPDREVGEEPKLIDFGVAKQAAASTAAGLTRTGQLVGTPDYMSPEQISARGVDPRSDVYSLGCLVFQMLTGRVPFAGSDDVQMLYHHLHTAPPALESIIPDLPVELNDILGDALAKEPKDRYASMLDFEEALARVHIAYGGVTAQRASGLPQPEAEESRGWRRRWFAAAAVIALLLGVGGFEVARRHSHQAPKGGGIVIITAPNGASVDLDGKAIAESTPTMVRDLVPGQHTLRIHKDKLAVIERSVKVEAGARALVDIVLPPASHRIEVRSQPEGAIVFLDDKLVAGATPTMIEVVDDEFHKLELERAGYETVRFAIAPENKDPVISFPLTRQTQMVGALYVESSGVAEVWIDGVDTGYTTPSLGINLAIGEHLVEVHEGDTRASQRIKIGQGETVRIRLTPHR
jgi:tRNA A-37 threonylcarbamoyl transferase component Bud32